MEYKAIGFDWGGVVNGKPGRFFNNDISELIGVSEGQFTEAYFHHNIDFNRSIITAEELWKRILAELNLSNKLDEVMLFIRSLKKMSLNLDIIELIDNLRSKGYKVGLLSNNTLEGGQKIRNMGLDQHFDVFHISAETGDVKPEPQSFIHLSDDLGIDPKELIFIDDSQKSLSTSAEVGFTPILYEDLEQCIGELKNLGIRL